MNPFKTKIHLNSSQQLSNLVYDRFRILTDLIVFYECLISEADLTCNRLSNVPDSTYFFGGGDSYALSIKLEHFKLILSLLYELLQCCKIALIVSERNSASLAFSLLNNAYFSVIYAVFKRNEVLSLT